MAGREDNHSSLEVHIPPANPPRSESPFPPDPVFVQSESPHTQISPSHPSTSFRDSEATKIQRYPDNHAEETLPKAKQPICGLQPITFWVLVALIFILCAGAIGGGVGGSVAVQSKKSAAVLPR